MLTVAFSLYSLPYGFLQEEMEAEMAQDMEKKEERQRVDDLRNKPRTKSRIESVGVRRPSSVRRTGL